MNVLVHLVRCLVSIRERCRRFLRRRLAGEIGQTTVEYALVLLGAASVALLLIAWVTGSGKIGQLFDAVFDHVISKVQ